MIKQEPFKKASRLYKCENTIVKVENSVVGGSKLGIIAGPCSVESEDTEIRVDDDKIEDEIPTI